MGLARVWRRQLYGASSAALIVPSAMLAALMVLALGGGFNSVGVLGQIFAGPPAPPSPGALPRGHGSGGAHVFAGRALPVIPLVVAAARSRRSSARRLATSGGTSPPVRRPTRIGSAIAPPGRITPIVSVKPGGTTPSRPVASPPQPVSAPPRPPQPPPGPNPPIVETVVKAVTPVTEQLPAPVGSAVTQAVQSAGATAEQLVPPTGAPPPPTTQGVKLR